MELASIKRRICAFAIDIALIGTLIVLLISYIIKHKLILIDSLINSKVLKVIIGISYAFVYLSYHTYCLSSENQATLGQKWMGISTIRIDGHKINGGIALVKCIPFVSYNVIYSLVGLITIEHIKLLIIKLVVSILPILLMLSFNKKKQTYFDLLSNTLVIRNTKEDMPQIMELAGIKRRICAFVLDEALVACCIIIILLLISCINDNITDSEVFMDVIIGVSHTFLYLCYNTYFLSSTDQATLGQKWMSISTIRRDGHKINRSLAFYRTIPYATLSIIKTIASIIPIEQHKHTISMTNDILDIIFVLLTLRVCFNKKKQTYFDLLSDTFVIKNKKASLAI